MDSLIQLLFIALTILTAFFLFNQLRNPTNKQRRLPRAGGALPIIGHLHLFAGKQLLHKTLAAMADKYGPVFTIKLGSQENMVVSSWETAKECFTTLDKAFSDRPNVTATRLLGYDGAMFGLAPYGPYWRQMRKIATLELLSHRRIDMMSHVRASELQASLKQLYDLSANGETVDMKQWFGDLTLNTSVRMIGGKRFNETSEGRRQMNLMRDATHFLKKAREEVDAHVSKDRHVNDSDIKNLVYLEAVVKETLRLYPAGPIIGLHSASEDCTLSPGYHVPSGTRLLVNIWKIQRDEKLWPEPLEFRPERFMTTHKDIDMRGHNFELIPFGSGRRSCPGIALALQMVHLTLASLLHCYEFSRPSDAEIDMTESPGLTNLKATPLEVYITPRLHHQIFGI